MCVHGRRRYLPDLPILSIFDALPLYKLLKTDRVCPRFAQLQSVALANRKMLTIFIGEKVNRKWTLYESELFFEPHLDTHTTREAEEEMAEYSALEMPKLNQEMVNWLKSTFPRVTKLRLIFGHSYERCSVMDNVIQLLEHWAEKLESFGIWTERQIYLFDNEKYLGQLQSLLSVIKKKLLSLQYFTIAVPCFERASSNLDVSFLGRLKLFSTNIEPQLLLDSLNPNGGIPEKLPEIRLFAHLNVFRHEHDLGKMMQMPSRLAEKITALNNGHVSYNDAEIDQRRAFFARFPALKCYRQYFKDSPNIGNFFLAMSQSSHLTCLKLDNVPFNSLQPFHSQEDLQPLSSLETLSIEGDISDRHFLSLLGPLNRLFPVLKCIKVNVSMWRRTSLSSQSDPIGTHLGFTEADSKVGRTASQAALKEMVSALMLTFAQLRLKGSLSLCREYEELLKRHHERQLMQIYYTYEDEFNFTDGSTFADWKYAEEKVKQDERGDSLDPTSSDSDSDSDSLDPTSSDSDSDFDSNSD